MEVKSELSAIVIFISYSWRVSSCILRYNTNSPAIQKPKWESTEGRIKPPLVECKYEWAFGIGAIVNQEIFDATLFDRAAKDIWNDAQFAVLYLKVLRSFPFRHIFKGSYNCTVVFFLVRVQYLVCQEIYHGNIACCTELCTEFHKRTLQNAHEYAWKRIMKIFFIVKNPVSLSTFHYIITIITLWLVCCPVSLVAMCQLNEFESWEWGSEA